MTTALTVSTATVPNVIVPDSTYVTLQSDAATVYARYNAQRNEVLFTPTTTTNIYYNSYTSTSSGIIITNDASFATYASTTGTGFITMNGGTIAYSNACPAYHAEWAEANARAAKAHERRRSEKIHRAKGAIKRAMKLIDNVGFGNEVRVFLGGDSIEVSHPDSIFKFVLSKGASNLIERTIFPGYSTPYKLELYTKTNVHVANLCVYLEDTPVLDQVLAVSLFIRSGEEEQILEKANWSRLTSDPSVLEALEGHSPLIDRKLFKGRSSYNAGMYGAPIGNGAFIDANGLVA
jgi:hypothetical protein